MTLQLGDVQTTALIPVAIKANETRRKNARVKDDVAVQIIEHLDMDTRPFDKFLSHEGVVARTVMLDRMVNDFVAKNPNAVIANLGSGFDNRFARVDNGKISWFDVDLPDSIAARKKVFDERERVTMIAGNVLEESWCSAVKAESQRKNAPSLFLAEGLFMYLSLDEISKFLSILKANFQHGTLIAEQNNPLFANNQKHHDVVRATNAVFKSGTWSGREIADLCDGIRFVEEHSFNEEMKKHSVRGWLFAKLLPKMNDRWAIFEW
ncbi:MAG: class I SAM-dependent methyltransferase [Treponema sp.]|nr:class I SAM-dependent methyltransferase [Treponema sp.]